MFQDELIDLLGQFRIESLNAFDHLPPEDKHYFLTRLYKCFDKGLRNLGKELQGLRGLKLHYTREVGASKTSKNLKRHSLACQRVAAVLEPPADVSLRY